MRPPSMSPAQYGCGPRGNRAGTVSPFPTAGRKRRPPVPNNLLLSTSCGVIDTMRASAKARDAVGAYERRWRHPTRWRCGGLHGGGGVFLGLRQRAGRDTGRGKHGELRQRSSSRRARATPVSAGTAPVPNRKIGAGRNAESVTADAVWEPGPPQAPGWRDRLGLGFAVRRDRPPGQLFSLCVWMVARQKARRPAARRWLPARRATLAALWSTHCRARTDQD